MIKHITTQNIIIGGIVLVCLIAAFYLFGRYYKETALPKEAPVQEEQPQPPEQSQQPQQPEQTQQQQPETHTQGAVEPLEEKHQQEPSPQEQLDKIELSIAGTKEDIEIKTTRLIELNKQMSEKYRELGERQEVSRSIDHETIRLKNELDVAEVQKRSAEEQIGQIESQLKSVSDNKDLEKKLTSQMASLNAGKNDLEAKMGEAASRLTENNRKQSELTKEIREMNKQISYDSKEKRTIEMELLELKKLYERERISRRLVIRHVKASKEAAEILEKAIKAEN